MYDSIIQEKPLFPIWNLSLFNDEFIILIKTSHYPSFAGTFSNTFLMKIFFCSQYLLNSFTQYKAKWKKWNKNSIVASTLQVKRNCLHKKSASKILTFYLTVKKVTKNYLSLNTICVRYFLTFLWRNFSPIEMMKV